MEHSKCFFEERLFRSTLKSPMMLCKNMESRVQCPHYGDRCSFSSGPSGKSPSNCGSLILDRLDQPLVDLQWFHWNPVLCNPDQQEVHKFRSEVTSRRQIETLLMDPQ